MQPDVAMERIAARARAARRPHGPELFAVHDAEVNGVPTRHYQPGPKRRPLLIYFHGGLWLFGDLDTHDRWCRILAQQADIEVLAVDYRLAPEHPWPAAVIDGLRVIVTLARPERPVALGGDSAGGCIAALCALTLRDAGLEEGLSGQVLVCPNTDLRGRSWPAGDQGSDLEVADLRRGVARWVPDESRRGDAHVSPLCAPDVSRLPPTVVVTAGHDPLRDEGDAFAARLERAGVAVTHRCEPEMQHGFIQDSHVADTGARSAVERLTADVRRLLAR